MKYGAVMFFFSLIFAVALAAVYVNPEIALFFVAPLCALAVIVVETAMLFVCELWKLRMVSYWETVGISSASVAAEKIKGMTPEEQYLLGRVLMIVDENEA